MQTFSVIQRTADCYFKVIGWRKPPQDGSGAAAAGVQHDDVYLFAMRPLLRHTFFFYIKMLVTYIRTEANWAQWHTFSTFDLWPNRSKASLWGGSNSQIDTLSEFYSVYLFRTKVISRHFNKFSTGTIHYCPITSSKSQTGTGLQSSGGLKTEGFLLLETTSELTAWELRGESIHLSARTFCCRTT